MATIALYANKVNQMPELVQGIKSAVNDYKTELQMLQMKALSISSSVCNLDDVISSIQSSTQTQDEKVSSFDALEQNTEDFIETAVSVDSAVADMINQQQAEFYEEYAYLKPECEKSAWDKFCDGCKSVGEWCKEHCVAVVTAVVVVIAATVAAVCGVAIAFIAGVAGVIALVLCIADVICMIATGGKDIATVLRENGFYILADIYQGISVGADFVSIVFPLAAMVKTIVKVGIKSFTKATITAVIGSAKDMFYKVFKSGFKEGVKNFFKIVFKNFIFDIDDFTKIDNGKRVLELWEPQVEIADVNKHWIKDGDRLIPKDDSIPKPGRGGHSNPDGLSMKGILDKYNLEYIPLKPNGDIDWNAISVKDVNIKGMNDSRNNNFRKADEQLKKYHTSLSELEKIRKTKLTYHENLNMKTINIVPTEIHANINHVGGVHNFKFSIGRVPEQMNNVLGNMFKNINRNQVIQGSY